MCSFQQKIGCFEQCKEPACSGVLSLGVFKAPISLGHFRHICQVLRATWTIPHPCTMEIKFMAPRHLTLQPSKSQVSKPSSLSYPPHWGHRSSHSKKVQSQYWHQVFLFSPPSKQLQTKQKNFFQRHLERVLMPLAVIFFSCRALCSTPLTMAMSKTSLRFFWVNAEHSR